MKEDLRQPPYLCPVCEAKAGYAIAGELKDGGAEEVEEWVKQRREVTMSFCLSVGERNMMSAMWMGLYGWLKERRD